MRCPTTWKLVDLFASCSEVTMSPDGVRWVPARPEVAFGVKARLRAAWLVFTGKADAVVWPAGQ